MADFGQHELAANVKVQQPLKEVRKIGAVLDEVPNGADAEVDVDRSNGESSRVPGSDHFVLSAP
jgi:hypothetical protein